MNNGKLQAKQEKLKSLHCPSTQSFLFNSRDSLLRSQLCSLVSHSPAPNPDQSAKSPSFSYQHNSKCAIPSSQHNDELATRSPQQLFIEVSTELLRQGNNVRFRAPGLSMYPAIREGEIITVAPISPLDIKRGDILLYLAGMKVIAHRVVRIKREKNDSATHSKTLNPQIIFTLQGDASPICDDPVEEQQVLGKVISVERHCHNIDLYSTRARVLHIAYTRASRFKRLIFSLLRPWDQIFIFNKKYRGDLL